MLELKQEEFSKRKGNRLAFRTGIIYFGIPALSIAILLLIGGNIINTISDDFSRRLARQYSVEAAANFITSTNSHFVLAQQLAHSTAISRWMVYGDNQEIRARAIEEIMGYAAFAPHVFLMFSSYVSLDVYDLRIGFTEEDFVSWWQIEEDRALWFFEAKNAKLPFSLNIQRTRPVDDHFYIYVWTNHRMYYQGRFVGIVTAGSPFQTVFDAIFRDYDAHNRRGYIIDYNGMVRVDSAELLKVFYNGWSHPAIMPETADNPALVEAIESHLQTMVSGAFHAGQNTGDAIPLRGTFRYASIAPIIGTNWSVVVLSSHDGFELMYLLPAITNVFAVLIISTLIGNILIRKIALSPLYKLTKSAAEMTENSKLFGLDRHDEIGDLARVIKQSRETIEHRERMLDTVTLAAQILLTSNEDTMQAVAKGMELVGRSAGVDRVHLWRNELIDGELHFVLKHKWVIETDETKKGINVGMSFPYSNRFGWLEMFSRGETINGPVSELSPDNAAFLSDFNVKSIVIQPLFINNTLFGSVSISDCRRERRCTDEEMEMFASTGLMFANALNRSEQEAAIKEALESERDTYELNQTILDAAPIVIGIWPEDGSPVANKQSLEYFGIPDTQMVTNNLYALSPELQPCGTPSPEKASMYYQKAMKEGYARFEWMHKRWSDGELMPAECIYKTFTRKGKTTLLSYTIDLHKIRKLEQQQTEYQAMKLTQKLLDNSPLFIEFWDVNGNILSCNQKMLEIFKVESKEKLIKRFYDFSTELQPCGKPTIEKNLEMIALAMKEGSHRDEWTFLLPDGETMPVDATWVHFTHQGEPMIIVYSHDLRPIKVALEKERKAEEENRAKTRFLARMSHEIRTPMNAVIGITELQLRNSEHPPETEEAFLRIYSSSNLLLTIINDILDLSKIEADKMEIIFAEYELASVIVDTVQLNMMHIGSKRLEIKLEINERLPAYMIGDEPRMKQILNNLLSNAFKYTSEGQVTLSFDMEEAPDTDDIMLVICVRDTGQGMTQEQIDSLFEIEFTRFNIQSNRAIEGSGLGMMIAHHLITLMKGDIAVESTVDKGSAFTVRIPQKPSGDVVLGKEAVENLQNLEVIQKSLKKIAKFTPEPMPYGRVLLVDDVESNLYVAKSILMPYKITVDTVTNGYDAVEMVKTGEAYDIIFMDHMMPGMDGIEATRAIRGMGYKHPIVALTANVVKGVSDIFMQSGFDGFVAKPINLNHFNSYLIRYIRDKQSEEVIKAAKSQYSNVAPAPDGVSDSLVESFLLDAKKALNILEPFIRNLDAGTEAEQEFEADALKSFVIQAHAMKSALNNVREFELSKAAFSLEKAGRKGDISAIRAEAPRFLNNLLDIVEKLSPFDLELDTADEDLSFLRNKLEVISQACEEFEITAAKDALSQLNQKQYSKKTNELLKEIAHNLLYGDYEKAAGLAKVLREDI